MAAMIYGAKRRQRSHGKRAARRKLVAERCIKHYYRERDKWRINKRRFNTSTFAKRARWPLITQFNTRVAQLYAQFCFVRGNAFHDETNPFRLSIAFSVIMKYPISFIFIWSSSSSKGIAWKEMLLYGRTDLKFFV